MLIFELTSFPVEQIGDLDQFEQQLGCWVAHNPYPMRLLAYSRPFDMSPLLLRTQAHLRSERRILRIARQLLPHLEQIYQGATIPAALVAAFTQLTPSEQQLLHSLLPHLSAAEWAAPSSINSHDWLLLGAALHRALWPLPYLSDLEHNLAHLGSAELRSATYLLLVWEPAHIQAEALRLGLQHATARPVRLVEHLPRIVSERLTPDEMQAMLLPNRPHLPCFSVLRSHTLVGTLDATTLHDLMALPFDLTIAIDIITMPVQQAQRVAEMAYHAARIAANAPGIKDAVSEQKAIDADRVLHNLRTATLHQVQIAILVSGEDRHKLRERRSLVTSLVAHQIKLRAVAGGQAESLRLFSTMPAERILMPWARSLLESHGIGCLLGIISFHRFTRTDGVLWGVDLIYRAPICADVFANRQAAHAIILGKTGYGKTFFLNTLSLRSAAMLGYRVIWVDAFENSPRICAAAGAGSTCHTLSLGNTLNLLDLVYRPEYDPERPEAWRFNQVQYVLGQLALLLGEPSFDQQGIPTLKPRSFGILERGYLERALLSLYAALNPYNATSATMPTLDHLLVALEDLGEQEASQLAALLRACLYGTTKAERTAAPTVLGQSFNGQTSVDWQIDDDIVAFDLTPIQKGAPQMLPFFYAQVMGALSRYMLDPLRDRQRPTLVIIDEFGLAAQIGSVVNLALTMTKVARKYGVGLFLVDQSPDTFLNSTEGRVIWQQARTKGCFFLEAPAIKSIAQAIPQLTTEHQVFLQQAKLGQYLLVLDEIAALAEVVPSALELAMLGGS